MAYSSSIYNNIYNYYNSVYQPKTSSRFDAHNKSELKKIYNSIVGISKEEPVFLLDRQPEIETYTIAMKESAMQFGRDIRSMGGLDAENMFEQKNVFSSDPDALDVSFLPGKVVGDEAEPLSLEIESLAEKQVNYGRFLKSDQLDIEPGSYSFDVSTPISNYELQFHISSEDTNYTVQSRLSRLVNNAAIGMTASVSHNGYDESAIVITSSSTGPEYNGQPPFEISDEETSQQRGIIDYLGIRDITKPATWAKYTVNGKEYTSPDNEVEIDDKYAVKLKKVTDEPVEISMKADFESLKDNILGVAGAYNQFIRTASEFLDKYPRTTVLVDSMKKMTSYYSSAMDNLGIKREDNGNLSVDEKDLTNALNDTATEDDISMLKDFTRSALRKITNIQLNPMDYADKRIVAYKNPAKTHFANPYMTSAYSGMLFNSYM